MNVVKREKQLNVKYQAIKSELLRKDTQGIRGGTLVPIQTYTSSVSRVSNQVPRYQFNSHDETAKSKKSSMGPPLGPPRSVKRKIITNTTSSKPESSSSGRARPKILASDSAAVDTSNDFCTPKNRPTALRYISSSSRGIHSGTRSARSASTVTIDASVVLAISEGRGMARGEIGMAAIDLRHPHLVLCQFSDTLLYTHTLTKINFFNPVEIIVPHTFCEGVQPNKLYQLIKDQYPQVNVTTVQRRHFNDAAGRQNIQTLSAPQYSSVYLQVLHKFYALTAAAAVLKYVEYIQCIVFARESLKIEYHSSEDTMIIDVGTATQLELVQPLVASAGYTSCLLGVLGPMYTVGGIRALRAAVLQPSCNKEFIENRLDAVQDLIENDTGLMTDLQDVIKKLSDIDKILLLCVENTNQNSDSNIAQLNQTLLLKTTMEMVPKLVEALTAAESGRLRKMKMDFENPHYNEIAERIRTIIQDDAHLEKGTMGNLQRCFAVKPNINGLLDVARRTYSELIEDIQKIIEQLSETYDLPIRLNQNVMKGFHIVLPLAPKSRRNFSIDDLPPVFIQVHHGGASVTMTTEELVVLDQQSKESLNEIQKMSSIVISSLLKELRPFMASLYKLCENVAELDILVALAHASTIGSYVRPEFSDYLDLKNSVHPLLDFNSQTMPVPNDVFSSPEQNFTIITGPNMGGKSIYIKQIAILQVMAQLGCFVPATNAVLRLCDRLYSRIGFNDSVELNASTYVYEIKEIQHIMKGLSRTSLVIIDELCRGTSEEEGTSIAWAICEELIASEAFTFFTTHFTYITRLQDLYSNVVNLHAAVTEETAGSQGIIKRLVYKHKIEPGTSKIENYGLALATKTHLPEEIVKLATELSELVTKKGAPQEIETTQQNDEVVLYKLNANIKLESRKHSNSEEIELQMLRKFKNDNPALVQRLKDKSVKNNKADYSAYCSSVNSGHRDSSKDFITYDSKDVCEKADSNKGAYCSSVNSGHQESSKDVITYDSKDVCEKADSNKALSSATSVIPSPSMNGRDKNTHTAVKSSTELLNSIMQVEEDANDKQSSTNKNRDESMNSTKFQQNNPLYINLSDEKTKNSSQIGVEAHCNNDKNNNVFKTSDDVVMVEYESPSYEVTNFSDNSSDIADAMTQIIEDCSMEETQINSNSTNASSSLDEEFIMDIVSEINEELEEREVIESIILTPPMEFRD